MQSIWALVAASIVVIAYYSLPCVPPILLRTTQHYSVSCITTGHNRIYKVTMEFLAFPDEHEQIYTYVFCLILMFTAVDNAERDLTKTLSALGMQMME